MHRNGSQEPTSRLEEGNIQCQHASESDIMTEHPTYSVVIPVFNSEKSLEELCRGLESVFSEMEQSCELIFVDDGSRDQSWKVLQTLREQRPEEIRIVRLTGNTGQQRATLSGLSFASGRRILTIDDDLQHPPAEIKKLHAAFEESGADLVYGIFREKRHSRWRNAGSRALKRSARWLHCSAGEGSSFRLIRRTMIQQILDHPQRFLFLDERFQRVTRNIAFTQVEHHPRKYGASGYTSRKLAGLTATILFSACLRLFSAAVNSADHNMTRPG